MFNGHNYSLSKKERNTDVHTLAEEHSSLKKKALCFTENPPTLIYSRLVGDYMLTYHYSIATMLNNT